MTDWNCVACPNSNLTIGLMKFKTYDYKYDFTYCGFHNMTAAERTRTSELKIYFISDSRWSSRGFEMVYRAIKSEFIILKRRMLVFKTVSKGIKQNSRNGPQLLFTTRMGAAYIFMAVFFEYLRMRNFSIFSICSHCF